MQPLLTLAQIVEGYRTEGDSQRVFSITLTELLLEFEASGETHFCPLLRKLIREKFNNPELYVDGSDESIFVKLYRICPDIFLEDQIPRMNNSKVLEGCLINHSRFRDWDIDSPIQSMRALRIGVLRHMISVAGDCTLNFKYKCKSK